VVIRFWADWCKYCEGEMKAIEASTSATDSRGWSCWRSTPARTSRRSPPSSKKIGVSYPVLLDEQSAIARRYGVVGLPTTYFVDGDGRVRGKLVGEADEATFERQVAGELLK
jgi:cytochrome c biogenesis protein CcmG/thiol:disulfide interchange protein DsbE